MDNGIDILDYTGADYQRVHTFEKWCVAFLRYAPRFTPEGMEYIEMHTKTDEIFVLLEGEATLLVGMERQPLRMEIGKMYNVRQGIWHNILVSRDAKVMVVENADTSRENTQLHYFNA